MPAKTAAFVTKLVKISINKDAEWFVPIVHEIRAFLGCLSAWKRLQKKVEILSWSCKSFRFVKNCLQLPINLWYFSNTNIFEWNSAGKNKISLGRKLLEKLALVLMQKTLLTPHIPHLQSALPVDISDRIISFPSTGKILEGALPPL